MSLSRDGVYLSRDRGNIMNTMKFWKRVKGRIKEKGITIKETAKACKFSYSTFRNWMYKDVNPPLMYADRISKYLGVSLEYLISGQGKDDISKTNEEILTLLKEAEEKLSKIRRSMDNLPYDQFKQSDINSLQSFGNPKNLQAFSQS